MIYADSGFLVAFRVPEDTFHREAQEFYEAEQDRVWLWSPWHRIEVFNTIRQLARHPEAKRRFPPAPSPRAHPGRGLGLRSPPPLSWQRKGQPKEGVRKVLAAPFRRGRMTPVIGRLAAFPLPFQTLAGPFPPPAGRKLRRN